MMTSQESQALQEFLHQLTQVRDIAKDPQAETMIAGAVARQPDAAYLLVQRAMLLEQALNQSKAQIAQLQNEAQAARATSSTSFLDSAHAWGRSATAISPRQAPVATSVEMGMSALPAQGAAPTTTRPGFFGSSAGGFLTSVASTAAGVAAGAFLFQGIENLMGHHGHGAGLLDQSNLTGTPMENTTINNYYPIDSSPSADTNDDQLTSLDDGSGDSGNDDGLTSI